LAEIVANAQAEKIVKPLLQKNRRQKNEIIKYTIKEKHLVQI
jgi:hypothetical protein